MEILYDPVKSFKNDIVRQLPFDIVADFEWDTAVSYDDNRFTYPEPRILAMGFLNHRLHMLCFTRIQNGIRVISFRKANKREIKRYDKIRKGEAANEQRW